MRWARFSSAFLLVCFCLLILSFTVSASDDQQGYLYLDVPNGCIQDNTFLPFDNNNRFNVTTVGIFPLDSAYNDLYFAFDVYCDGYSLLWSGQSLVGNSPALYSSSTMQFAVSRFLYESDNGLLRGALHIIVHLTASNTHQTTQTLAINQYIYPSPASSVPLAGCYVKNFVCTSDRYEILRRMNATLANFKVNFDNWVADDQTGWAFAANNLDLTRAYIWDLRKKFTQDSFTYQSISYNDHDVNITEESAPWYIALLNSIKSIVAPVAEQADQEQKAKDVGAFDAMDEGYSRSNFWALIDIFEITDFGDYDDDVIADASDDGPFDWFSNYNKSQLDTVDQRKLPDDDFISFYDDNIEDILDILTGARSRRKRGDE